MKKPYDNSQVSSYRNCPLARHLKYDVGLAKITEGESEHDRNFGKAIHEGLESWYQSQDNQVALDKFKASYPVQLNVEDMAKTQENGVTLLKAYFTRYKGDFDKFKILSCEQKIEWLVGGREFVVKCDLVVENKQYGGVYSLEHKTTGKALKYDYWSQYEPNHQLVAQAAGIKSKYGDCSGIIVNALSLGYRQRKYKDQPAGFHFEFERHEFNQSTEVMKIWEQSTLKTIEDIEADMASGRWAMNTGACRFCSYKPICQAGWSWPQDEELILLQYQQQDPYAYLESTSDSSQLKDDANADRNRVTNQETEL